MNRIEYTQDEIDALLSYTGRESSNERPGKKLTLNQLLGITGTHENTNSFLRFINGKSFSDYTGREVLVNNSFVQDIRDTMKEAENLYSFACKYGMTHRLPQRLKRGDEWASRMESDCDPDTSVWQSDQFLSCSTGDVSQFARNSLGDTYQIFFELPDQSSDTIPFINVNDALTEIGAKGSVYDDEKEILLVPGLEIQYEGSQCDVPAPGQRGGSYKHSYYATVIGESSSKDVGKECTDEDLAQLLEHLKAFAELGVKEKNGPEGQELRQSIEESRKKVGNFIRGRFQEIGEEIYDQTYTMDEKVQKELERLQEIENTKGSYPIASYALLKLLATNSVLERRLEVGKRRFYRDVFPQISHRERLEKELGIIQAEKELHPGDMTYAYATQDFLELSAHARVEDRERDLGIQPDEMTLGDYINIGLSKYPKDIPTDVWCQKLEELQNEYLREHRITPKRFSYEQKPENGAKKPNKADEAPMFGQ